MFLLRSFLFLLFFAAAISCTQAQTASNTPSQPTSPQPTPANSGGDFFRDWFNMVSATQAAQPHWMTPVATTTPRLEQEFRYDIFWQTNSADVTRENYGGAKGLELIPQSHVEVILVAPPAYIVHNDPAVRDGFGDWGFLVKYRILSANEEHGNYILTAFFQTTLPTGQYKNGATNAIIIPTIAYGKGFGHFDFQGTFGASLPTGSEAKIGRTYPWNNVFQYHLYRKFWPELEVNYTYFQDGLNNGKTQVYLTPGLVLGRFHLWKRLALSVGGGFQIAATHFYTTNHNGIFTVRFPF
ncbi:MAG: hypothetical protein WCE53_14165 [Candidatus Acidiferrum sp.]